MFDLALALLELGHHADYQGSTTGNDKAAFDALVWRQGVTPPNWGQVQAVDHSQTGKPTSDQRVDSEGDQALRKALVRLGVLTRDDIKQDQ